MNTNLHLNKSTKPYISPLTFEDVESVVSLSQKYFPRSRELSIQTLKRRMVELYFKDGKLLPNVSPLVSRSTDGSVNGFLGVTTKTFRHNQSMISVANCHHLMATDEGRKKLMPIRLLQQFLSGPQDISFSDGSSIETKQLWERLGGESVTGESIYYKIPLRPVSFSTHYLLKQSRNQIRSSIHFLAACTDSIAGKIRIPHFYRQKAAARFSPLDTEMMDVLLEKMKPFYDLFPEYLPEELDRLFQLLEGETRFGSLQKAALLDQNSEPFGWFIYFAQAGVCEVIQAVSIPGKENDLFNSLAWHAYSMDGVELSGRLMPSQLNSPFTTEAIAVPARMWTLMKSNDLELKYLIQSGNAFMTRLEGDLWVL